MKIILLFATLFITGSFFAQRYPGLDSVVIEVSSPASIKGTYKVTGTADNKCYAWLDGPVGPFWGIDDVMKTAVTAKFVLVKDSTGANITNAADLAGNIAVVYSGGTYNSAPMRYKQKLINIQAAGAAAVIIISSVDSETYAGGNSTKTAVDQAALAITIPLFVIGNTDGLKIGKVLSKEPVSGYVGKMKTYDYDLKIDRTSVVAPRVRTNVTALVQEGDVNMAFGLQVKNNGLKTHIAFRAKVKLEFENKILYRDSSLWINDVDTLRLKPKDTTKFFGFKTNFAPKFDLAKGVYKVTYTVNFVDTSNYKTNTSAADFKDLLDQEQNSIDNSYSYTFDIADSVFAIATISSYTDNYRTKQTYKNVPDWSGPVYLASTEFATSGYEQGTCIVLSDKNASRLQADGITFAAFNKERKAVKGQLVKINVYEWADKFTSMGDTVFGFKNLIPLVDRQEYTLQDTSIWNYEYVKFDSPVRFENNKRYLACIHSKDSVLAFGYDKLSVSMFGGYLQDYQPVNPVYLNGKYYRTGFGYLYTPAVAFNVSPQTVNGVTELDANASVKVYPNPVSTALNVAFDLQNAMDVNITVTDLSGKVVYANKSLKGDAGTNVMTIDTKAMNNGMYVLNVISDNNVVSKKFTVLQ